MAYACLLREVEMSTTTIETKIAEKELLDLENRYWRAIKEKDVNAMLGLTEFPCLVAGAMGVGLIDRENFVKMMKDPKCTLHDFKVKKAEVRALKDDVACVAYEVHEDMTVDGKKLTVEAADTSVWVRHDGRWLCAMHTETVKGDPFGRDRKTAASAQT
ncbi:MAG: nuclear transport factor 2 family protein [Thermoanaerobaculia bacterium]